MTAPTLPPAPILDGATLQLRPLARSDLDSLCQIGLDPDLWRWIPEPVSNRSEMDLYIEEALKQRAAGTAIPFVIAEKQSHALIGCTRFGNIDLKQRRVEIGWTWLGRRWQRTRANTEAKYLLLGYAFESLSCIRVELKTDALNERSRAAILRLGAKEEGILRQHMITASGRLRDTVYFSILDREWPEIKRRLEGRLDSATALS